jgi:hypothetical protein
VYFPEAERLVAITAIEMGVQIVDRTGTLVTAHGIFQRTGTIVNTMNQVMIQKEIDRPENRGLVYRVQFVFKVKQAECPRELKHTLQDQQAHSRWLDTPSFQFL